MVHWVNTMNKFYFLKIMVFETLGLYFRQGISFQRATPADHERVWRYVAAEFSRPGGTGAEVGRRWAYLATMGLAFDPPSLHLAEDAEGPIGFVVTQVAAPGRLGPMGVSRTARNRGVGKVLALRALSRGSETSNAH